MTFQIQGKATGLFGILLACMALAACGKQEAPAQASSQPAPAVEPVAEPAAVPATTNQTPAHALLFVPAGKSVPADLASRIREWKSSGVVANAVLLEAFGGDLGEAEDQPGFNGLAILDFPDEAAYEAWVAQDASSLGPDLVPSRVDVLLERRSKNNDPARSIYVVGEYESLVSPEAYKDYTDAYIEPNMSNQMFSGIMTRFTMYLEREPTGGRANPEALLVTEYANQAEYGRKKAVKDAYKAVLLSGTHPEWARINDEKKTLRIDVGETYANPVAL